MANSYDTSATKALNDSAYIIVAGNKAGQIAINQKLARKKGGIG